MMNKRDSLVRLLIVSIVMVVIASVGALGFVYYRNGKNNDGSGIVDDKKQEAGIGNDDDNLPDDGRDDLPIIDPGKKDDEPIDEDSDGYLYDASIYQYVRIGNVYCVAGFAKNVKNVRSNLILPTKTPNGGKVAGIFDSAFAVNGDGLNSKIKRVVIPSTYTLISESAFENSNIEAVYIGLVVDGNVVSRPIVEGNMTIKADTFKNCTKLVQIEIYKSVKSVDPKAFNGATNVNVMIIESKTVLAGMTGDFFGISTDHNIELLIERNIDNENSVVLTNLFKLIDIKYNRNVEMHRYMVKKFAKNVFEVRDNKIIGLSDWAKTKNIEYLLVNSETTGISKPSTSFGAKVVVGCNAFTNNANLKGVVFDGIDVEIEENAFAGCVNLKTLEFNTEQFLIRRNAFASCIKLSAIKMIMNTSVLVSHYYEGAIWSGEYAIRVDKTESKELIKLLLEVPKADDYNEFSAIVG